MSRISLKKTWFALDAMALLALLLALPRPAAAYTDPGSGAMVFQLGYALFLGASFYLRRFLNRALNRRK